MKILKFFLLHLIFLNYIHATRKVRLFANGVNYLSKKNTTESVQLLNKNEAAPSWDSTKNCLVFLLKNKLSEFMGNDCKANLPVLSGHYSVFILIFLIAFTFPVTSWIIYRVSHEYEVGQLFRFSLRESGVILGSCSIVQSILLFYFASKLDLFCCYLIMGSIFLTGIIGVISYQKRNVLTLQIHVLLLIGTKLATLISLIFVIIYYSAKNSQFYNEIYFTNYLLHPVYTYLFIYYMPFLFVDYLMYIFDLVVSLNTLSVFRVGGTADEFMSAKHLIENKNARWLTRKFVRSTVIDYTPHFQTHKLLKNHIDISSPHRYSIYYRNEV
ncbi:hypothetical protein FG386_001963 [Cryptosporidium ryanae]|uniref:uncharacterized protein n=1 Tax=Cryptosporidium ryanae TaxID=515981 RepID=UPI00351A15B5|nr:hypothetical protein FG386_001963 [Cryptosporidium ryanae]